MIQKYALYFFALLLLFTNTQCTIDVKPTNRLALISQAEYLQMLEAVKNEPFSTKQLDLAKELLASKNKALTIGQTRQIASEIDFETKKLDYVKFAYDYSHDKSIYGQLEDLFKFDSRRDEFRSFVRSRGGQ